MAKVPFQIRMDEELKDWLDQTADKLHMTTTALTVMMLSQSMDTTKQLINAHNKLMQSVQKKPVIEKVDKMSEISRMADSRE